MNTCFNEYIRNYKKNCRNINGVYLKTSHISAAIYHKLQNLVPNQTQIVYSYPVI